MTDKLSFDEKAMLKFDLLSSGIVITKENYDELNKYNYRLPKITRSGASFGIEVQIDGDLFVNVPISKKSKYSLSSSCDHLCVNNEHKLSVRFFQKPNFYKQIINGKPIEQFGRVCFDRLGITLKSGCFFEEIGAGCKFCGIGHSLHGPSDKPLSPKDINIIIKSALNDPTSLVKHVLLSSGAFSPPDFGATFYAECVKSIKREFNNISIYIMLPAPLENKFLDALLKSGVDEIALNIEMVGDNAEKLIPGKRKAIGLERYLDCLEYLAERSPKHATRSILMSSLENSNETLRGVQELSSRNVMPIISAYRKIGKTNYSQDACDAQYMFSLWKQADEIARNYGMLLGPLCIPCQGNTIAIPNDKSYTFY